MGAVPAQRESVSLANVRPGAQVRVALNGTPLAPGAARGLLRAAFQEWTGLGLPGAERLTDRLAHDAMVVLSELVTNAVVHAGTDVELVCRLEPDSGAVVVEVCDHHPSRPPRDAQSETAYETPEYGRGLRLVAALSEAWGVTYRRGAKTVWARLSAEAGADTDGYDAERAGFTGAELLAPGPGALPGSFGHPRRAERDRDWLGRGALSFLAEASDLLAGQLDEDLVAALTGQLIVPRLADWCAVWLEDEALGGRSGRGVGGAAGGARLARVWHASEERIEELRRCLEKEPPRTEEGVTLSGPVPYPYPHQWPSDADLARSWPGRHHGTGAVTGDASTVPGTAATGPAPGSGAHAAPEGPADGTPFASAAVPAAGAVPVASAVGGTSFASAAVPVAGDVSFASAAVPVAGDVSFASAAVPVAGDVSFASAA
ncbi:ATP-binding protein, partial [Streptomyces cinereospinus]